uniref:Uncharacterized protein n=1 Tax=Chenopodium quinoa TaxID=63459 RepID=A0A803MBU5_CHEQI
MEVDRVRKDELYMLHNMLHVEPIDIGAFLIQQLQHVANNNTTGGKIVQGGFITRIETYLGYNEDLKIYGFVDGIDDVEIPSSRLKKKDGTTLWCTHKEEGALLSPEKMSLKDMNNWSFTHSSLRDQAPLLP